MFRNKILVVFIKDSGDLNIEEFKTLFKRADEIAKILFSILKTTRINK